MISLSTIYSSSPQIVARKTGDEYVLVPVSNSIADMKSVYTLNITAAFIWEKIDGKRSVQDIIDEVVAEFEIDESIALKDVLTFFNNIEEFLVIAE
jgi:methyltransferase-like protein